MDSGKRLEIVYLSIDLLELPERDSRIYRFPEHLERLKKSIKSHGVMVPLVVCHKSDSHSFIVMDGVTRFKVCQSLSIKELPCMIYNGLSRIDFLVLRNIQNIQRKNYEPVGTGYDMLELHKIHGLTYSTIGSMYSVSKGWVAQLISLTRCPSNVQMMVSRGEMSVTEAYRIERADRIGSILDKEVIGVNPSEQHCYVCKRVIPYYEYYSKVVLCSSCLSACKLVVKEQKEHEDKKRDVGASSQKRLV